MKKPVTVTILLLLSMWVEAQQLPQYTQYFFNNYLLNPAVTGIENYTDVKAGYRSQWTGLNGAPVTSYLTVNAPLGTDFTGGDAAGAGAAGGYSPYSRAYTQNYMAAEPHHGIGLMLISDRAGPINTTNIDASYAYHLGITNNLNVSVGVAAGVQRSSLNTSELILENPLDPAINNGNNSQWKPDLSVGVWAYAANYYVGVSVQQLLKERYFSNSQSSYYSGSTTVPHYFFTAGYKIFMTDEITFIPSVMLKVVNPVPVTFDVNGKFTFGDRVWIGGSYRHNDGFAAVAGININSTINVGYSYDVTTSNLNTVSNGTHEIVIGLLLNNRYNVICPQHSF